MSEAQKKQAKEFFEKYNSLKPEDKSYVNGWMDAKVDSNESEEAPDGE